MEYSEPQKNTISQAQIDMFLATHGKKFATFQLMQIKDELPKLTEEQYRMLLAADFKDPMMMLIISLVVGVLGIDRFMLGDTALGVIKLLSCGGLYVWMIIDWFLIQDRTKEYNYNLLLNIINGVQY